MQSTESLQWTRNGLTQTAFQGEPMQIRSRMCAREFNCDDRPDLYAEIPPLEALKSNNIDRSEPQGNVFNRAHRRVTCVLPREGPEARADTSTSGGQNGHRRWESRTDEEEHVRNEGRGQQLGRARQELDSAQRTCFTIKRTECRV